MNEFHRAWKRKKPACRIMRISTKYEEKFEKFQEKLDIFDQNPNEKLTFSQFFATYFLEFCLLSESIYPLKITPDFYNFSDFWVGRRNIPAVPSLPTFLINVIEVYC